MAEDRRPIGKEWKDGFNSALAVTYNWMKDGGELGPATVGGKPLDVFTVCDVVEKFDGTMPEKEYRVLCNMAPRIVPADQSYVSGARCLRRLIQHQKQLNEMLARERGFWKPCL